MQPAREHTATNAVLEQIKAEGLDEPDVNWKPTELERGAVLYNTGDRVRYVYFPISCVLSTLASLSDGSTLEVNVIGREGAAGMISGTGSCEASARSVVLVSGTAVRAPVRWVRSQFSRSEGVRAVVIRHVENLIFQVQQSAVCATRHPVEARLARWLLAIQDRALCDSMRFTHEFVAGHLGVNRTSVTLAAADLQRQGLITYRRGVVRVVDRGGLEGASCECYGAIRDRMRRLLR
jgi:CRP-like cAMP-binding protein